MHSFRSRADTVTRAPSHAFHLAFLTNARRLRAVVRVIQANTNTNYITHSEVIEHRAEHTRRWAHFRRSLLADDIRRAIHRQRRGEGGVLVATRGRSIVGVAVLLFDLKHRYGIVEDIVINEKHRGNGIGHRLLDESVRLMRDAELENVILESGIRNESAHAFFRRHGFREAAIMFLRRLETPD
ncbi:acetyltransferase [Opitutaceae bacterium TAV1]|nr:GCN5 family acetyltransferase [Opitutaceae bacterium TAV5]EIQ02073.1 acetyltransferase [Opitutaceae bacterium TAV1]